MIQMIRVDYRLLHGQVAVSWTSALGADCILLVSDTVLNDKLRLQALSLAKPEGAQTLAELLNGIFPGFVTLGLFGIVYLMLKKKMNPLLIMLVILLVSIAGAFFGVLGVQ